MRIGKHVAIRRDDEPTPGFGCSALIPPIHVVPSAPNGGLEVDDRG